MDDGEAVSNAIAQVSALLASTLKELAATPVAFPGGIGKISIHVSLAPAPSVCIDIATAEAPLQPVSPARMGHPMLIQNMREGVTLAIHDGGTNYRKDFFVPGPMTAAQFFDADPSDA